MKNIRIVPNQDLVTLSGAVFLTAGHSYPVINNTIVDDEGDRIGVPKRMEPGYSFPSTKMYAIASLPKVTLTVEAG